MRQFRRQKLGLGRQAGEIQKVAQAGGIFDDRPALGACQDANDALMAGNTLKRAFHCDVSPILAEARRRAGGAIDPITCYRAARYRERLAPARPAVAGSGSGIV